MDKQTAAGIVADWMEYNVPDLDYLDFWIEKFMREAYNPAELGREYGYTEEEALRGQLENYARDAWGWTHPNEA